MKHRGRERGEERMKCVCVKERARVEREREREYMSLTVTTIAVRAATTMLNTLTWSDRVCVWIKRKRKVITHTGHSLILYKRYTSLIPRPLPALNVAHWTTLKKNWEWPGDEARLYYYKTPTHNDAALSLLCFQVHASLTLWRSQTNTDFLTSEQHLKT